MSDRTAPDSQGPLARAVGALRNAWFGLAFGTLAIGVFFQAEIAAAVRTWIESTAYNHCALVIPIVLYLIWDRQSSLRGLAAAPMPTAALLALPAGIAWLIAERLGIMEGRQLAVVTLFEVLCLAMLGWRLWCALLGPLLYLYFLVPFGEFLTPKLQDITAWFIQQGIGYLGFPAYIDGYIIEIPEGTFFVAEACAGLRFLIASIAFGALYAILMYRSHVRRTIFIAVSIIVPIIANGFRALGIVWLGHILGSAEAAAADHIVYGWLFFSFVILMLTALGLPFREDADPVPATDSPMIPVAGGQRRGMAAGLFTAVLAAAGPVIVMGLTTAATLPATALRPIDLSPACVAAGPAIPAPGGLGPAVLQRVNCAGLPLNVRVEVFSPRSTAAPINAERRRLTRLPDADDISEAPLTAEAGAAGDGWRLIRANKPAYLAAAAMWIDGVPTLPGMAMRLHLARTSLTGLSQAPVLVTIVPVLDWGGIDIGRLRDLETRLSAIVGARRDIGEQVRAIVREVR